MIKKEKVLKVIYLCINVIINEKGDKMGLEEISIIILIIAIALYFIGKYLYEKYGDDD